MVIHQLERKTVIMVNMLGELVTENQRLQEKLDNICKEATSILRAFADTVAAPKSSEATMPGGGPAIVTSKIESAHSSSSNIDIEDEDS